MTGMSWLKSKAKLLKNDTMTLFFAVRDPRTPWYAKLLAALVVGYALSPIDLIPDFIPVIGYLDDLIIVPLGVIIALKLIPREVIADCRSKAAHVLSRPRIWFMAAIIILVWLAMFAATVMAFIRLTHIHF